MTQESPTALELDGIHAGYGGGSVLHGVSLHAERGETVCLLGRNGAGKTTTLRAAMGLVRPRAGRVIIEGAGVTGWPPHRIARLGVGYVPEDRRIFPTLTVRENLELGRAARDGRGGSEPDEILDLFPQLAGLQSARGMTLSGGEQQMLALARALMTAPRVLLLDEPAEGLAPVIVEDLKQALRKVTGGGITVLLAEQNIHFVLELCDRAYVIDRGEIRFEGPVEELRSDEELLNRYLAIG